MSSNLLVKLRLVALLINLRILTLYHVISIVMRDLKPRNSFYATVAKTENLLYFWSRMPKTITVYLLFCIEFLLSAIRFGFMVILWKPLISFCWDERFVSAVDTIKVSWYLGILLSVYRLSTLFVLWMNYHNSKYFIFILKSVWIWRK